METLRAGRAIKIAVLIGVLMLLPLGNWPVFAAAYRDVLWSAPINLSNTPQLSTHPAIVADDFGYVHVFWSEETGGRVREPGDLGGEGNTILYTRWDGMSWTPPIDILFVPAQQIAEWVAVAVGPDSRLHVVWTSQEYFYYSNAFSWEAESAHAWSKPVAVAANSARSRIESSIVADANGTVHILYATRGDNAGVYYIRTSDDGGAWTLPRRLSQPLGLLETYYANVRLVADGAGFLHAVWQTGQEEGYGQAVYYTRSVDGGEHWSAPWQFGYRDPGDIFVEWPYLTVRGDAEIHLIYIDGATQGRLHRISLDNGETWSAPRYIIPELEGINGYVVPVVDGDGDIHLIANMRTRGDNVVGIYYSRWDGANWSPTIPLDNISPAAPSAHYTAATVRLGNEIIVVYTQISIGEIWMLRGILPSVEPAIPLESAHFRDETLPTPVADGPREVVDPIASQSQPGSDWDARPFIQGSEWHAVVIGLISSISLVGVVFVWARLYRRK